jgi:hypothetical protein
MACALTQGYNLDCRDSFGGVKEVYLIEKANATTITETAGVVTGITKAAAKSFFLYNLIVNTADGTEEKTDSRENGTSEVKQTLTFPLNKMQAAVRNEILLLAKNRLLAVVVDQNGKGWLYGYDNGMMTTSVMAKTGTAKLDRNGYEITLEAPSEKELSYEVDAATILTLLTPGS